MIGETGEIGSVKLDSTTNSKVNLRIHIHRIHKIILNILRKLCATILGRGLVEKV